MSKTRRVLLTAAVALIAMGAVALKYRHYVFNPWTRDGQVRAQVIQITPRVTGPLVRLAVKDNQRVKAGDLLFEIDPRTFEASLDQARAQIDQTRDDLEALEKQVESQKSILEQMQAAVKIAVSTVSKTAAQMRDAEAKFSRVKTAGSAAVSQQVIDDARAQLDVALANSAASEANLLESQAATHQAEADLAQAEANLGAPGDQNAQLRAAKAALRDAELNLEFTKVTAPVDGYVTNLNLRKGSPAVTNQPALALVDVNSYWIDAFFKETVVGDVQAGDHAVVTLMSYPDAAIRGRVDSIGWGVWQQDGSTGPDLLPEISATFEWIRLAQRVPVRVHLVDVPESVKLRVGTTASVLVMKGTSGSDQESSVAPVPKPLE